MYFLEPVFLQQDKGMRGQWHEAKKRLRWLPWVVPEHFFFSEVTTFSDSKGSFIRRGSWLFILLVAVFFPVGKERFACFMSRFKVEVKVRFVQSTMLSELTDCAVREQIILKERRQPIKSLRTILE